MVDFFLNEDTGQIRIRLVVGFKIKNAEVYVPRKYGAFIGSEDPSKAYDLARKTFDEIPKTGEIKILVMPWHMGQEVEQDDDGVVIGDYKRVAELSLPYEDTFVIESGELPGHYRHLKRAGLFISAI